MVRCRAERDSLNVSLGPCHKYCNNSFPETPNESGHTCGHDIVLGSGIKAHIHCPYKIYRLSMDMDFFFLVIDNIRI